MKADEIRKQMDSIRKESELTTDQKIALLHIDALLEVNSTLMFIKNNLR